MELYIDNITVDYSKFDYSNDSLFKHRMNIPTNKSIINLSFAIQYFSY